MGNDSAAKRVRDAFGRRLTALVCLMAAAFIGASDAMADAAFQRFLDGVRQEAMTQGITKETLDRALAGLTPDYGLPDLVIPGRPKAAPRGQAEFSRTPEQYIDRAQIQRLAKQGQDLQKRHTKVLDTVEREVGVDRHVVLAIWGRETAFGTHKLRHNAIRVLATQAFTGRRPDLFRRELLAALKLVQDGIVAPEDMKASWAGAMGLTQFMPTEFFTSGLDLDRDGKLDLFHSVADALGSAARQLKLKGWVQGLPWGIEIDRGVRVDCGLDGPANERSVADWISLGIKRRDGKAWPMTQLARTAYLMSPAGAFGPSFLVTENFKVLRAYNTSDLYATFVGHLSDRIAGGGEFRAPWQAITQLSDADILEIQRLLKARGHDIDKLDGKIGSNTRWQIGKYERDQKLPVGCWPTRDVLRHLQANAR